MSRAPYQRMGDGSAASSAAASSGGGGKGAKSPRESASAAKHHARQLDAENDPQAPWLTHLEYSVDPLLWEDDEKHQACPLCKKAFSITLMGSGRHHCRMCGVLCCAPCSKGALDLPGYDSEERVCEPCRKRVLQLRSFLHKNQEVLINNMHHNRSAVEFQMYSHGSAPWATEVWLSQSLLLLMWRDRSGAFQGVPVSDMEKVVTGFSTDELRSRRTRTVACCITSQDDEFAAKEPLLLSVVLRDGRTLDLEAPSPQARAEWSERLSGLQASCARFVKYHIDAAHYPTHMLLKKETERLSIKNVLKEVAKAKSAERASKNPATERAKAKYARK